MSFIVLSLWLDLFNIEAGTRRIEIFLLKEKRMQTKTTLII